MFVSSTIKRLLYLYILLDATHAKVPQKTTADSLDETSNIFRDRIEDQLDAILEALDDMEDKRIVCNISINIGEMRRSTEKMKRALSEDTMISLVKEDEPGSKIVLEVPHAFGDCLHRFKDKPAEPDAAELACLREVFWSYEPDISNETLAADEELLSSFGKVAERRSDNIIGRRNTPEKRPLRVRKEYRTLTKAERRRFHKAINKLFQNGTVAAFGRIHSQTSQSAHRGLAFLPWHRIFIKKFEDALRAYDDTVTLPYWDCTVDSAMEHPVDSIMWTGAYFGNMAGNVVSGFAKGWTSSYSKLHRLCGEMASLPSSADFQELMSHCYITEVSYPAGGSRTFEQYHNLVHAWVGGDMSAVGTAAYDPMFYLMHCFIDCKWEEFRRHQRRDCGVEPTTDYPSTKSFADRYRNMILGDRKRSSHRADDTMTGMPEFRNIDGISEYWTSEVYTYAPTPTCENNCGGSTLMYCDEVINYCVSKSRLELAGKPLSDEGDAHLN